MHNAAVWDTGEPAEQGHLVSAKRDSLTDSKADTETVGAKDHMMREKKRTKVQND